MHATLTEGVYPSYVIITPAFNEEKFIQIALSSVIKQTIKPSKWIIVDDGSTDNTANIVKVFAKEYDWIYYHYNKKVSGHTYYSSNVYAILEGIRIVNNYPFTYLAILDADIELCNDYYERIIKQFIKYPDLGIATGTYLELENGDWVVARIDRRSTPKALQVFKRICYEASKGYIPFRFGGEDTGMEIMARMNGWKTWSFEDIVVKHHRPVGTGDGSSILQARLRLGMADYCIGTHPLFMVFKTVKRMLWEKPYCISGLARLAGYLHAWNKKFEIQLPNKAVKYLRREQMQRIFKPYSNFTIIK